MLGRHLVGRDGGARDELERHVYLGERDQRRSDACDRAPTPNAAVPSAARSEARHHAQGRPQPSFATQATRPPHAPPLARDQTRRRQAAAMCAVLPHRVMYAALPAVALPARISLSANRVHPPMSRRGLGRCPTALPASVCLLRSPLRYGAHRRCCDPVPASVSAEQRCPGFHLGADRVPAAMPPRGRRGRLQPRRDHVPAVSAALHRGRPLPADRLPARPADVASSLPHV
jgi:hypothetical protein